MGLLSDGPGAVTLGAADRALALAEVKAVLRVGTADEDALIAAFAETALGLAEQFTGRVLIARALTELLPPADEWQRLAATPVRSIAGVERIDAQGTATTLAVAAYAIDIDAAGEGWVRASGGGAVRLRVSFEAGSANGWAQLPGPLSQGAVLLAAHLFEARDAAQAPPAAVTALWRPFRAMRLTAAIRAC